MKLTIEQSSSSKYNSLKYDYFDHEQTDDSECFDDHNNSVAYSTKFLLGSENTMINSNRNLFHSVLSDRIATSLSKNPALQSKPIYFGFSFSNKFLTELFELQNNTSNTNLPTFRNFIDSIVELVTTL